MLIHHITRTKAGEKTQMNISISAEKAFDNPTPFHDKNSQKTRNREKISQHDKWYLGKSHS